LIFSGWPSATAADPAGDYVVVWRGTSTSALSGVRAQSYTAAGAPRGPEILVSADGEDRVGVAMGPTGDFVVIYSRSADGSGDGVYARRFDVNGTPIGSEFLVNTTTAGAQADAAVAMDGQNNAIIVWETPGGVAGTTRVFARRFGPTNTPLSGEITMDNATTFNEALPTVAADAAGNFVIAWDGSVSGNIDIYARRFNAVGERQGADFLVNMFTVSDQFQPAAAMDAAGNFVITWMSFNQAGAGSNDDVYARRYDSGGAAIGNEFLVNTFTTGNQDYPSVSMSQAGDFVIAWQDSAQESMGGYGVYAQRFSAAGSKIAGEIHVNTSTTNSQRNPAVAMDGDGDFVVTWQSNHTGSNFKTMAQRFGIAPPQVSAVQVNNTLTDPQRSRVTSIRLIYSSHVFYAGNPVAAFTLTRQSDGVPVTFGYSNLGSNNAVGVISLTNFSGPATEFGSLTDGRYTLRVLASQVSNLGGAFDGNGDLIGGDDYVLIGTPANGLFRLFGDSDGNGTVNAADFLAFRSAFGGVSSIFDFNNNGSVDASDFLAFRSRFGSSV
jgi:hypothetical protein